MAERDLYIDRLRTAMTALVVVFHAAITYGGDGGWFYHEVEHSASPSSLLLTLFCATNQAYFMGFFFLLAGYFTPPSLQRKGYARFIADRFLRLGLPLLAMLAAVQAVKQARNPSADNLPASKFASRYFVAIVAAYLVLLAGWGLSLWFSGKP